MAMNQARLQHLSWLPGIVTVVAAGVVAMSWYLLNLHDHARIQKMTVDASRVMEVLVRRDIENRVSALQLLAHRWKPAQAGSNENWQMDLANYIADQPGFQAIEWADADFKVHQSISLRGVETVHDLDITSVPEALAAALEAQESHSIVFTPPIKGKGGDNWLAACVPQYQDGQFSGLVVGVFRVIPWLSAFLTRGDEPNYHVGISIGNHAVYTPRSEGNFPGNPWLAERALSLYGLDWSIQVAPSAEYISVIHSRLSMAVLVLGLLLSAFLGVIVQAAMKAKHQALQLESSAERLTALLENLPGMAFRFMNRENWPADFVSEGCRDLSGYSKSDLERRLILWGDLIHPDDRAPLWHSVQDAVGRNQEFENEYRIVTKSGQERWVWSRGRAIKAENGHTVYLEGLVTDITNRKEAATALVDAEAYAKAVVETAAEAVITIEESGRIETFNRAAQEMFGYTPQEIVGQHVRTLLPEPSEVRDDQYVDQLLENRRLRKTGTGRDATGRRKDGSLLPIRLSVSEVVTHNERKLVGLIRDLSEQRAAEQEAREHRERLAHVDRLNMLGEMATGIAHEINQPLSAISMYAQSGIRFLDSAEPRPERLRDALEKLGVQAHRAGAIIERMQQLGKQHESQRESIDGNLLMMQVHNLAETEARIRDMEIKLDLCTRRRRIVGDPVQIQQVALNLLRNGMEAMESSGRHHGNHIVLRTRCEEDGFRVFVVDSGIGVSEEVAEKLYQPFSTTKKTGMGLGLSICRSIISAHGGQLGFFNNDQGGTTFYFVLPYAKGNRDEIN